MVVWRSKPSKPRRLCAAFFNAIASELAITNFNVLPQALALQNTLPLVIGTYGCQQEVFISHVDHQPLLKHFGFLAIFHPLPRDDTGPVPVGEGIGNRVIRVNWVTAARPIVL